MLKRLEQLLIDYPTSTLLETNWTFRRRRLQVVSVRDLLIDPLTTEEYLRRPLIHRGRYLVKANDLETQQVKQFYLASSQQFYRPAGLRLALYWPDQSGQPPAEILSKRIAGTRRDRIALAKALQQLRREDFGGFDLRITIDRRTG
jgi:hypothetical protein